MTRTWQAASLFKLVLAHLVRVRIELRRDAEKRSRRQQKTTEGMRRCDQQKRKEEGEEKDEARQNKARQRKAKQEKGRPEKARRDRARQDKAC